MFNPYHKWLGIPEGIGPPTHYQLLGIAPSECDPDVIQAAAIRQSSYIRNFQTGKYSQEATRILNEIAAAKTCLLDLAARAKYDAELEERNSIPSLPGSAVGKPPVSSPSPYALAPSIGSAGTALKTTAATSTPGTSAAQSNPVKAPAPASAPTPAPDLFSDLAANPVSKGLRASAPKLRRRKESNPLVVMAIVFAAAAVLVAMVIVVKRLNDKTIVVEDTPPKPSGVDALIDRNSPPIPRYVGKDAELEKSIRDSEKKLKDELRAKAEDAKPWVETASEPIHLLEGVNADSDSFGGQWLKEAVGGVLSPKKGTAILRLPINVPAEYRLKLELTRLSKSGAFGVGLVAGGRRFLAIFDDGTEKKVSGLELLDDRRITDNPQAIPGERLPFRSPASVVFEVRSNFVTATVNGRDVFKYDGSYDRLRMPVDAMAGQDDELVLVSKDGEFMVKSVDLIGISYVKQ